MHLDGEPIEEVKSFKYLGVLIASDLKWDTHITVICRNSKKLLCRIYRNVYTSVYSIFLCRLYISLVRPEFEYACHVRDLYTHKCRNEYQFWLFF